MMAPDIDICLFRPKNASSFSACSQLLANLSGFQYTRKAWKREVFELLLESSLFQMDMTCLSYWTTIIDNLMTHDITSFRDLMSECDGLEFMASMSAVEPPL